MAKTKFEIGEAVTIELINGCKSEIIDSTVIGFNDKGVKVKTYFGATITVPAEKVKKNHVRKEVISG